MRIIIDAMGGDHAPQCMVEGAVQAAEKYGCNILLVGKQEEIDHILKVVPEVVQTLRNMSPVWRDLQTGKREYIL